MSKDKDRGKFRHWLREKLGRRRRPAPIPRDLKGKQLAKRLGISLAFYRPLGYNGDPPTMDTRIVDEILTGLSAAPMCDPVDDKS